MTPEEQLPEEKLPVKQEESLQSSTLSDNTSTCLGQSMPAPQGSNGHWECGDNGWVWYDDIG